MLALHKDNWSRCNIEELQTQKTYFVFLGLGKLAVVGQPNRVTGARNNFNLNKFDATTPLTYTNTYTHVYIRGAA